MSKVNGFCKHYSSCWFRSKIGFRKLSTLVIDSFFFAESSLSKNRTFPKLKPSLKVERSRERILNNPGYDILELSSVFTQVPFTANEIEINVSSKYFCIQVSSRFAKRL